MKGIRARLHDEDGELRERIRDIRVKNRRNGTVYAYFGIGNQTDCDNTLPLRVVELDAANYRSQVDLIMDQNRQSGRDAYVEKIHAEQKLVLVVTTILYFGRKWNGPRRLLDMVEDSDGKKLKGVLDHEIHIVELGGDEEFYRKFRSDFRWVVRFLSARKKPVTWKAFMRDIGGKIRHVIAFLDIMRVMTGDNRYAEVKKVVYNNEEVQRGDGCDMCQVLDWIEEAGIEIGEKRGEKRGLEMGEDKMGRLFTELDHAGQMEEYRRAVKDVSYRNTLFERYAIL